MTLQLLVLCTHNSARSVLAEAMFNHWAGRLAVPVRAFSAGSAPRGAVHPLALAVLQDAGIDTQGLRSKSWDEFAAPNAPALDLVITVCDSAAAEVCPYFPGSDGESPIRVHWAYPDPSRMEGDELQRRRAFELTRQAIGYRVLQLLTLPLSSLDRDALREAVNAIARR